MTHPASAPYYAAAVIIGLAGMMATVRANQPGLFCVLTAATAFYAAMAVANLP